MSIPIDPNLKTAEFDYVLPPHLIAQSPAEPRDASRLLVLDRCTGAIQHTTFRRIGDFLSAGDVVVANNSRVIWARLEARRASGGLAEILLLRQSEPGEWEALARPSRRLKRGELLAVEAHHDGGLPLAYIEVREKREDGIITIGVDPGLEAQLDKYGRAPLPPYITAPVAQPERYQTVYASASGSAAAPTAGLHFSEDLIASLAGQGIEWLEVTLHIGLDTFRPVTVERVADHHIHSEWCTVSDATADHISLAKREGRRVVALGTTAARTLETAGQRWLRGKPGGFTTYTTIFIAPGYRWRIVDGMITNFHLPRSTLLMMISAFAERDRILATYREAIEAEYRFYSFGDAMLIV